MLLRTAAATVLVASLGGLASAAPQPSKVHVGLSASFVTAGGGKLWVTDHTAGRLGLGHERGLRQCQPHLSAPQ